MNYVSTRGQTAATDLSTALLAGLSPDGGLYVPESLPQLSIADFDGCNDLPSIATRLLQPFFAGDALADELASICTAAFNFPATLRPLRRASTSMLELFHGPTAAFKDFGARFLAQCLARLHSDERALTIIVATSGDTGAAVAGAFHQLPNLRVVILYPDGRVSPRQAHQLGCFGDNVVALKVAGNFDDCQRLAKQALADCDLQNRLPLSSANSISLGRLLPQMSYYAYAALQHQRAGGAPLGFVIPTGNLGNAMAAILARAVGLPIGAIALATNANKVLPEFFAGGDYQPTASVATLANAMDVGAPSNFERLRWLYPDDDQLRAAFRAVAISDSVIRSSIVDTAASQGVIVCPHTACALAALDGLRRGGDHADYAVVATAHPAKFEQIVEPLLARSVPAPAALAALLARPAHAEPLSTDYADLVRYLISNAT